MEPPCVCQFPELLRIVLAETERNSQRLYKTQARILRARQHTALLILQGLLSVARSISWDFMKEDIQIAVLSIPTSTNAYSRGALKKLSHVAVNEVIVALETLGWVERRRGYFAGDQNFQTAIWPTKALAKAFGDLLYRWAPYKAINKNLIRLKNYDAKERKGYQIPYSPTPTTHAWNKNLHKINKMLCSNVISLHVDDFLLCWVRRLMASEDYRRSHDFESAPRLLDFHKVQLHRSFVRKCFDLGGRFHGAWWQSIPSRYRRYIQINGQPTIEYDFNAMHPRLLYAESIETLPPGDPYDFGYSGPDPKKARGIYKFVVNALINADSRGFLIPDSDLRFLGMTQYEVISQVIEKHPLLERIRGKGHGLRYQFIESQIAEAILLRLMDEGIVCLPVHDSFLVAEGYGDKLKAAMEACYTEIVGIPPVIKAPELPLSDFEPAVLPSGELDLTYLCNLHAGSIAHRFQDGYFSHQSL